MRNFVANLQPMIATYLPIKVSAVPSLPRTASDSQHKRGEQYSIVVAVVVVPCTGTELVEVAKYLLLPGMDIVIGTK